MHSLVKDLMTTPVVTVEPTTPFKEIVARLAQHRVSAVPVVDNDQRVLGVVSEADLLLKEEFPRAGEGPPAVVDQAGPTGAGEGRRLGGSRPHDRGRGVHRPRGDGG
jgi:CBS domain-containing protein